MTQCFQQGCGVLYEFAPSGTENVLHTFGSNADDGLQPYGTLTKVGNALFGTTLTGGSAGGGGTVFKYVP
jgi:uncharacterized repeat protein (TIGR03803 family)